jgi:hypothetical protein
MHLTSSATVHGRTASFIARLHAEHLFASPNTYVAHAGRVSWSNFNVSNIRPMPLANDSAFRDYGVFSRVAGEGFEESASEARVSLENKS